MIVVSDRSALVALVNIGHIDLLPSLFGRIRIPSAVSRELASGKRPAGVRAFIESPPDWLEILTPIVIEEIPKLDEGERAAISLAVETKADRIIMDEVAGRRSAQSRHIEVIGTIGILIAAAERELVDLEQAFLRIKATDFWISPHVLDELLSKYRSRK